MPGQLCVQGTSVRLGGVSRVTLSGCCSAEAGVCVVVERTGLEVVLLGAVVSTSTGLVVGGLDL